MARGGNRRNAILLDGQRVLNEECLRFPDELARHKILDVIGDLALVGTPILGRFIGYKPGHKLNHALLVRLFEQKDAWCYRPLAVESSLRRDQMGTEPELKITGCRSQP